MREFVKDAMTTVAIIGGVGLVGLDDTPFLITLIGVVLLMTGLDARYVERNR